MFYESAYLLSQREQNKRKIVVGAPNENQRRWMKIS